MNTVTGQTRVEIDPDVQAVLEFIQSKVQPCRLIAVSEGAAQMAKLLWSQFPQEPCTVAFLRIPKTGPLA